MSNAILTPLQARRLLAQYRAGHLTQAAFCQKHAVSPSLFGYWRSRLHAAVAPAVQSSFQELHIQPTPISQDPCILILPTGAKVEFPSSHLATVLSALVEVRSRC